jgi:hypothetical protein
MFTNTPTEPTRSPEPNVTPQPKKPQQASKSEWNILFYLVGDGLISASMISQLKAITDAGFEEDTNVLVYFDPNCNGKNARIFDVNARRKATYKSKDTGKKTVIGDGRDPYVRDIAEDCHIPSLPQIPAEITLRYFLEYAREYYPAQNYMLFLMGHGVIVGNDTFLPDPDDNSAITMSDLGWILRTFADKVRGDGDEFHLIGFHSCSMSSVELLYELAGSARYMIGTQGAAFPGSWPYRQLLKKIFIAIDDTKPAKEGSPEQVRRARTIKAAENGDAEQVNPVVQRNGDENGAEQDVVGSMLKSLQNLSFYNAEDFWLAGFSADISLCRLDTEKVNSLREPIEELSLALQKGLDDPVAADCIRLSHLESQSYWQENYTDLFDFCSRLWNRCQGDNVVFTTIRAACRNITLALKGEEVRPDRKTPTQASETLNQNGNDTTLQTATLQRDSTARPDQLVVYSDYYGPAYQFSNGLSIYFPWRRPSNTTVQTYRGYKFTREHGSKSWWSFLNRYFKITQRDARATRRPMRGAAEVASPALWRSETNLLRTLSDERLLSLGPPPARVRSDRGRKASGDLSKVGGDLSKVGGDLSKVGGDLSKVGGDLSQVGADLFSKVGGDLTKVGGDLATKIGFDLAKVEGDLAKILGDLSKVGGDLSKVGGDLSTGRIGGDLSKIGGDLSKVGGDLSKVGGDLAGKVGGDLAGKVGGDLAGKVGGDLAGKVGGDLGGLYGHTVIKNFASPEDEFITSRPDRFDDDNWKVQRPRKSPIKHEQPAPAEK